jgi:hypothetical protein
MTMATFFNTVMKHSLLRLLARDCDLDQVGAMSISQSQYLPGVTEASALASASPSFTITPPVPATSS